MSKHQKLIEKFKQRRSGITYQELRSLLSGLGYKEQHSGKTSGSRIAFFRASTKHIIRLHKPHPGNELKKYQIDFIHESLLSNGYFK
jgi:hypothetical protein